MLCLFACENTFSSFTLSDRCPFSLKDLHTLASSLLVYLVEKLTRTLCFTVILAEYPLDNIEIVVLMTVTVSVWNMNQFVLDLDRLAGNVWLQSFLKSDAPGFYRVLLLCESNQIASFLFIHVSAPLPSTVPVIWLCCYNCCCISKWDYKAQNVSMGVTPPFILWAAELAEFAFS